MQTALETTQRSLFATNTNYRLWKYAVIVSDTKGNLYVKDGDHRCETKQEALAYAAGETTGKIRGVLLEDDILGVWDMTDHAKTLGKDPSIDVDASRGYDDEIRGNMPLSRKFFKNFMGKSSLELHPIPKDYIKKEGNNWRELLAYEWDLSHKELLENNDIDKEVYKSRPYLDESFAKTQGSKEVYKFLLAAATGAGKETSTLALLIHIQDQKQYNNKKLNVAVATIPSTTSELFNELGTVAGMNVGDYGFVDYSRIKPYITDQWYKTYYSTCSKFAKLYIRKNATVVKKVAEIPATHEDGVVPVLFGSFHDLALKSNEGKIDSRYKGLEKRIGTLAIGEAHQMLSNADNKMWKNLNRVFGKKCFKLFITGTPYDFIYGNAAAEFFGVDQRALFTRNDLYKDKRTNPDSHYLEYPDFNFYGINVKDVVKQLKQDYRWEGDENGFTFNKLFTYDPEKKQFVYEKTILWLFRRMFGMDAFSETGDPLSIYNAPGLCDVAKRHGMIALPVGDANASAKVYINALKNLLVEHGVFPGEVFDAYDDDLGDRKDDIASAKGMTLTLTCNKDCTGANIPELGYFVFMRKLGDSVKFFEQATGRVGRKYPGKTNCGVFLADLENSMNVMLTIEEKISVEREEDFSVNEMINELLANYNFFAGRNGEWEAIDPIDFASTLEELNAKGNYGINQCLRNTDPDEGFDLFFANTTNKENKRVDINSNGNTGAKNSNRNTVMEQMGLPFDKKKSFKKNWANAKLNFASKCRWLAFLKGATTVNECVVIIENALEQNDKKILQIVGKGAEWFPTLMTDEHIDVRYTNRWIQKFNDKRNNFEYLLEMLADPIHRTDSQFIAEPNRLLRRMTAKTISKLKKKKDISFIDVCGGRGGFIIYFLKQAKEKGVDINTNNVYYNDIDTNMSSFFKQVNIEYKLGIPEENITSKDFLTMEINMEFDAVITNPPYLGKKALHQQVFNKAVTLAKDGGNICFIQPATPYFNKKVRQKKHVTTMVSNLKKYIVDVEIVDSEIFETASVSNDLAITHLIKTPSTTDNIERIKYKDGCTYTDVPIEHISSTRMPPEVYAVVDKKYMDYIAKHGSLQDALETDPKKVKAKLAKIRGVSGRESAMWYTLMPKDKKYWGTGSDFGIKAENQKQVDNAYEYFKTNIARFGLALSKFTNNHHQGELKTVPLVKFDKIYTDQELCNMIGITPNEYAEIEKVLMTYYD